MIEYSEKQKEALKLLHSGKKNILLYGGSRSGKTFTVVSDMVAASYIHRKSRHLIGRQHRDHAKASIWRETLKSVLDNYPKGSYQASESDLYVKFFNGSEIHVVGFDDAERTEKIFGREFCTCYVNEASQVGYDTVNKVATRLAQKVPGYVNRMIYDANPPAPSHWLHKLFIEKVSPKDNRPLTNPDQYGALRVNPTDNPLLDPSYIETLKALPERDRRRFLDGDWVKAEYSIFEEFDIEKMFFTKDNMPKFDYFTVGVDHSGTRFAAVLIGWAGDRICILDELGAFRETIQNFDSDIQYKWKQYAYQAYGDPSQPVYNSIMFNCLPAENAVMPGLDYIKQKIHDGKLTMYVKDGHPNCPQLLSEMESYHTNEKGQIVKENDDYVDALRYGIWSHAYLGGSIITTIVRPQYGD